MVMNSHKWLSLIILGILAISLIFLAGGCTKTDVFFPEPIPLEPPPIMITADQLYEEHMADETAADAKYKGKEVWVTEAIVDSYLESENGCYLMMRYVPKIPAIYRIKAGRPAYIGCSVKLEPQFAEGFKDVGGGYVVEIIGECLGISNGVVTLKINRMAKTGVGGVPQELGGW